MANYSFISDILLRHAELDRKARIVKCGHVDCHEGKDYTATDGICHWCNGTGYRKEKAS